MNKFTKSLATIVLAVSAAGCSVEKQPETPAVYTGPSNWGRGTTSYNFAKIEQPKIYQGSSSREGKVYFHPQIKEERNLNEQTAYVYVGNSLIVNGKKYHPHEIPGQYIGQPVLFIAQEDPRNHTNDDFMMTYSYYIEKEGFFGQLPKYIKKAGEKAFDN
jgi:hypothetical protein